ncbi:MAG: hypothetical protein J5588_02020 [Bacteroidales bacterium]|nr:hypothetical protein [Bacteroidales bacterium]
MHVFAEYTLWLLPICVIIGVGLALFLYYKETKLKDAPLWLRRLLIGLRAFAISFVLFLLLGPFLEMKRQKIEKPTVVFLHDNSASLVQQKDSSFYQTKYKESYQHIISELQNAYQVATYTFGADVIASDSMTYTEQETNISGALQDISTRYYNQNIGAVILASDGIYNKGENPKYAIKDFPSAMPIYTIAMGDTVQECDNVIAKVLHNQIAFRGNPFAIKVSVESHALKGNVSKLRILDGKTVVFETSVRSDQEHTYKTIDCKIQASEIGQKIYTVEIEHFDQEISEKNNSYTFAVDVLESRQKILFVYDAVHPDIAAVRRAIENNKNYECSIVKVGKDKLPPLQECNCLILCGMKNFSVQGKHILTEAIHLGIPCLLLNVGNSLQALNELHLGMEISNFRNSFDEVKPRLESDFSLFSLDEEGKTLLLQAPPLFAPYGTYNTGVLCRTLCYQQIGSVDTERPLITFSETQGVKIGFVLGEGLWRWRLYAQKEMGDFEAFDSFVNKMLAYMALTEKREMFVVSGEQIVYDNQDVAFSAELYDKSYEAVPNQEITLVITNENGKEYPFIFSAKDNFYSLNAGKFPLGKYGYKASVTYDNSVLTKKGSFVVMPMQLESQQTRANHSVLADLSEQTGGKMYSAQECEAIVNDLQENKNIVSVAHSIRSRNLFVDLPLILIIILLSISAEWFLRKYYATY